MSSAVRPLPVSRLLPCRGSRSGRASCLRRPFLSVVFWPTLYSSYRVSFFVSHLHTFLYRTWHDLIYSNIYVFVNSVLYFSYSFNNRLLLHDGAAVALILGWKIQKLVFQRMYKA